MGNLLVEDLVCVQREVQEQKGVWPLIITAMYYLWVIVLDSSALTLLMDCIGRFDCRLNQRQAEYKLHCRVFWNWVVFFSLLKRKTLS